MNSIQQKPRLAVRRTIVSLNLSLPNNSTLRSGIKSLIVRLAVWGVVPANWATWLIRHGGLKDA
jgi:hypothetical protein